MAIKTFVCKICGEQELLNDEPFQHIGTAQGSDQHNEERVYKSPAGVIFAQGHRVGRAATKKSTFRRQDIRGRIPAQGEPNKASGQPKPGRSRQI
jgi:hypothetical protein